jgi:hypothetical protein
MLIWNPASVVSQEVRDWLKEPDKMFGITTAGELMRSCKWVNGVWGEGYCTGYFRSIAEISVCSELSQLQPEARGEFIAWVKAHPEEEDRPAHKVLEPIVSKFCP